MIPTEDDKTNEWTLTNGVKKINQIPFSIYDLILKTITSQNFKHKLNMGICVSLELYRVMISSLLLIFVPQQCGDHTCTITENTYNKEQIYSTGLLINYITASAFCIMYFTEMRREEKLIKLLEVNDTISTDNYSVGKRLQILADYKKKQLFMVNLQYQIASFCVFIVFMINTVYSGIIINSHSLGNQTIINFITNILFMFSKLSNVLVIVNTDTNIFFSAYMNTKVQFNDIDPREMKKINRQRQKEAMLRNIEESGGRNLLEINKIKLLEEGGGFIFIDNESEYSE
jgi:hypothetical protein